MGCRRGRCVHTDVKRLALITSQVIASVFEQGAAPAPPPPRREHRRRQNTFFSTTARRKLLHAAVIIADPARARGNGGLRYRLAMCRAPP